MHISELRILHYRNFLNARFKFQKGVNTLIGENGSGKTNALYALRLLLDDSISRNATYLRESDFCRALNNWQGHWIIISIDFEELDPSEGCQLLKHTAGHMNDTETGTYTFYYRPKLDIRNKLHEMNTEGTDPADIREYLSTLTIDDYEPLMTGRGTGNLLNEDIYKQLAGDFENLIFPDPNEDDQNLLGVRMGTIHPEITCTFAKALRDVVSDLRGYRSNPLLTLLRGTESSIQIEDIDQITDTVTQLNKDISALPEIKKIADGVQDTLHSTVGYTYSPSVNVQSALPDKIEKLLQRLTLTVADDPGATYHGDLSEQSLGGANLIYLALKLLEYEVKLSGDRVAHFLLIEEPEAHIHTHIQKTLFERQSTNKTQVIVSTHSTHISSAAKIQSVNVLARRKDCVEVYQPVQGLTGEVAGRVERYLDAVRSTLLFAKGVILVEGDAELIMLPSIIKAAFGLSPDEIGISIISMNAAFFEHVAVIFHNDRIKRRCAIVTDLDKSLFDISGNPDDDSDLQKHEREAEAAGEGRQASLAAFKEGNPWIDVFFATHTFEVDFLSAGNASAVDETVDKIYTSEAAKERVKEKLNSIDIKEFGHEILRLANKLGKGWFALLLSEGLSVNTFVPDYILQAIAFAGKSSITQAVLTRMGLYRLSNEFFNEELRNNFPPLAELELMTNEVFLATYRSNAPDDNLSKLIACLEAH